MKVLLFSVALCLVATLSTSAQAFNLPVSTTSTVAEKAYEAATYLGSNLRLDAARMEIAKALEADPDFFMAYVYDIQVLVSDDQKASVIEKALAIDSANFNEAEKIMRQQLEAWAKDPKALPTESMKALVAAYPTTPEAYEWAYLHAAFTEGNIPAALAYAEKLSELDPYFPPVYNGMGYLYLGMKQMDKAQAAFEKYIELAPAEPNAYDSMGEYYMITEDYAKSAEYYDRAAALGLESSKVNADKARAMIKE